MCLLGITCPYDGKPAKKQLDDQVKMRIPKTGLRLIPICPEQLAGLPTPRKPVEIMGGDGNDVIDNKARVVSRDGEDFTEQFRMGAEIVFSIAKLFDARQMITQKRSPSCSSEGIYDGTFDHVLRDGKGVCAAFLEKNGIGVVDIDDIYDHFEELMNFEKPPDQFLTPDS